MKKIIKIIVVLLTLFLSDIISKYFIINKLPEKGVYFFRFAGIEFYKNKGIAFGININKYIIIIISALIIIMLICYFQKYLKQKQYLLSFFIGLISIGAISNLMDRIINGYIIDFICVWILPIFNLSDLYIIIGAIGIIFFYKKIPHQKDEGLNAP